MPRAKSNKPKRNVWKDVLYGTYEGSRGNPDQWRAAFAEAMSPEKAKEILGDDSPWAILGLKVGAALAEIKAAFRQLAKKFHPDHNRGNEEWACQQFIKVRAAYVQLTEGN